VAFLLVENPRLTPPAIARRLRRVVPVVSATSAGEAHGLLDDGCVPWGALVDVTDGSSVDLVARVRDVAPQAPLGVIVSPGGAALASASSRLGARTILRGSQGALEDAVALAEDARAAVGDPPAHDPTPVDDATWSAIEAEVRRHAARGGLTPTETVVLCLLAGGERAATIRARLGITVDTYKTHARRIHQKLGVDDSRDAALRVLTSAVARALARR